MSRLVWDSDAREVRFRMESAEGRPVPVEQWGVEEVLTAHGRGSVARLLALWESEEAQWDGMSLRVPHERIAELDAVTLRALGLPPPAGVRLQLLASGPLSARDFRLDHQLVDADGIPLMGAVRQGVFLEVGGRTFTLLNPLYEILERVEDFRASDMDVERKFLWWGELKALLPEDADVDDHLASMEIVRADAFTLDWDAERGLVPTPLGRRAGEEADSDAPLLAGIAQQRFVEQLRAGHAVGRRYALGGGWYMTVDEGLAKALSVVKEYMGKPLEQQRAFLESPSRVLKERLGDELEEPALECLFRETPLYVSARVKGLGRWEPKVCAYVVPAGNEWLPPEERVLSVVADGAVVQLRPGEVGEAIAAIRAAQEEGRPTATVAGQEIPATDRSLEAFRRLAGEPAGGGSGVLEQGRKPERLVPLILDNLEDLEFRKERVQRAPDSAASGAPRALRTALLPHQREGLKWLMRHWAGGSPGALLADDMGLGKTLQALAFLARVRELMEAGARPREPFLVVAPTGLLRNWEAEAERHLERGCLGIVRRLHGGGLAEFRDHTHRETVARLQAAGWVLTTYETMRDRIELFMGVRWAVAVFDEAQKIKNPVARVTEMAKAVGADFTLAMTGTPVENRLADLWSIVDAVHPGFLGPLKDFHEAYEIPAADNPAQASGLVERLLGGDPPLVLRRLKADHLQGLPERRVEEHAEEMPPAQSAAYDAVIERARARRGERGAMLEALHGLRRISLMAGDFGPEGLTDDVVASSARLSALVNVLDRVHAAGEKALVFVEYLDVQQALLPYLQKRYGLERPPPVISGSVPGTVRQRLVDAFQKSPRGRFGVMILSPKAGGVGLTITAANHVVHLTRWWNPAVEEQCNDRVYRIGQEKPVTIHLLHAVHPEIREHSFDLNLHALLKRKKALCEAAFAPPVATDGDLEALYRESVEGFS